MLAAVVASAWLALHGVSTPPSTLHDCTQRIELGVPDGYSCLIGASLITGQSRTATEWLSERLGRDPYDGTARVARARLLRRQGDPNAESELVTAIEHAAIVGDLFSELMARASYARLLATRNDPRWESVLAVAHARAERSGDPFLRAEVLVDEASVLVQQSARLGHAAALLDEVEADYPDMLGGPLGIRVHNAKATLSLATGRPDAAAHRYRAAAELADALGRPRLALRTRYNEAVVLQQIRDERAIPSDGRLRSLLLQIIDEGIEFDDPSLVAAAQAMAGTVVPGDQARPLLERCMATVPRGSPSHSDCLRVLAWLLRSEDIGRAEQLLDEALRNAAGPTRLEEAAATLEVWADLRWVSQRRTTALIDGLLLVGVVETLRARQVDAAVRDHLTARWAHVYYETAGRLLQLDRTSAAPQAVALAFNLIEQLRVGTVRPPLAGADTSLDLAAHRTVLHRRASTGWMRLAYDGLPTLHDVQAHLRPNEAMLSFQLDILPPFEALDEHDGGGSWVTVITAEHVKVHPLPDARTIAAMAEGLAGLSEQAHGAPARARHAVYRALLEAPLRSLPSEVDSLLLIPDGALFGVPFAALAREPSGAPLVQDYAVQELPSAHAWLTWRRAGPPVADRPALLFADPTIGTRARELAAQRAPWRAHANLRLGRLPHARTEIERIADHLGPQAVRLQGAEATETRLLDPTPRPGLVHIAAHAVFDPRRPEQSALVLASDASNDGVVQLEQLAPGLLDNAVVVLAACHSAEGEVLRGPGLSGLAQGFVDAGARAVVASRWPLSDAASARFFDDFYARIARGHTVSDALAHTQRAWIDQRRSPSTWASFVVLGDGSVAPMSGTTIAAPDEPAPRSPIRALAWLAIVLGAVALVFGATRRR